MKAALPTEVPAAPAPRRTNSSARRARSRAVSEAPPSIVGTPSRSVVSRTATPPADATSTQDPPLAPL